MDEKYERKICRCKDSNITGHSKNLGGQAVCSCGGIVDAFISPKVIMKQFILDRFIELAIFYGKALSRQDDELEKRYKNELKQRFEELLYIRDAIEEYIL